MIFDPDPGPRRRPRFQPTPTDHFYRPPTPAMTPTEFWFEPTPPPRRRRRWLPPPEQTFLRLPSAIAATTSAMWMEQPYPVIRRRRTAIRPTLHENWMIAFPVQGGPITAVTITNPGSGYTAFPLVIVTDLGGTGHGAIIVVTALDANGGVAAVEIVNGGENYTYPIITFVRVTGAGGGATGSASISPQPPQPPAVVPTVVQTIYATVASRFQPAFDGASPGVLVPPGDQLIVGDSAGRPVVARSGTAGDGNPAGVNVVFNLAPALGLALRIDRCTTWLSEATGLDFDPASRLYGDPAVITMLGRRGQGVRQTLSGLVPEAQYVLVLSVGTTDGNSRTFIAAFAAAWNGG